MLEARSSMRPCPQWTEPHTTTAAQQRHSRLPFPPLYGVSPAFPKIQEKGNTRTHRVGPGWWINTRFGKWICNDDYFELIIPFIDQRVTAVCRRFGAAPYTACLGIGGLVSISALSARLYRWLHIQASLLLVIGAAIQPPDRQSLKSESEKERESVWKSIVKCSPILGILSSANMLPLCRIRDIPIS